MKPITIVLADDHDIVMDGLENILSQSPGVEVVGKATTVSAAAQLLQLHQPQLLITDISMGNSSGLDLTRITREKFPHIRILVLSMHDSLHHVRSLMDAGAMGYLLKTVKPPELIHAIETVMSGKTYIQESMASLYERATREAAEGNLDQKLSPREIEILRLVIKGLTSIEMSQQLFLSEHTISTHRKNIARKTGTKTVIGLLNYAREKGIVDS